VLIERAEPQALRAAIQTVAAGSWDREALRSRALEFSTERFLERMRAWLDEASTDARGRPVRWVESALQQ
jgi:hypothetical protein